MDLVVYSPDELTFRIFEDVGYWSIEDDYLVIYNNNRLKIALYPSTGYSRMEIKYHD